MSNGKTSCSSETVRIEDFVEYYIYPSYAQNGSNEKLHTMYSDIMCSISSWTDNYLWHKDKFNLSEGTAIQSSDSPYFHGIIHFGENIDDEWFLVYVIKKLSEHFDIICRVVDSDGEFMLIEAANYLSEWMKPDMCDRRIYIHKGIIKIIPLNSIPNILNIDEVISYLNNGYPITETERKITLCINEKIERFSNLEHLLHRSRVYLPIKVAALLDAKPDLISAATTAFFYRDIIDEKICSAMKHFPPNNLVLRLVTFTKFLYAMISKEKCNPKRNQWNLPLPSDPLYKEYLLGYKITNGFEILAAKNNKSQSDLTLNKKWNQYFNVLRRREYFKDLIEGSKEFTNLERKARTYFLENIGLEEENYNILNILQTVKYSNNEIQEYEEDLLVSDDEKWMEINEDQFNKLLELRFQLKEMDVRDSPNTLSCAIDKFLNQMSDIEGVELRKDESTSQMRTMDDEENANHNISFNPDNFLDSVQKIIDKLHENIDLAENSNEESVCSDLDDYDTIDDDDTSEASDMKLYMDLMDQEVQNSTLAKNIRGTSNSENINVDVTENILKSYEEQLGGAGPAGNLLYSIGLTVDTENN